MNENSQDRRGFNFILCLLICVAAAIFYGVVSNTAGLLVGYPHWLVLIITLIGLMASAMMINQINNVPVQSIGFVLLPALLGVVSAKWMGMIDPSVFKEAGLATVMCVGITMLAAVLFPSMFRKAMGVLMIALVAVIITSLISTLAFHVHLSILDYISVVIFMGFLGYDIVESQDVPPTLTYAIALAGKAFLDILNIFTSIISIEED